MPEPMQSRSVWFCAPREVEIRETTCQPPAPGQVQVRALYSAISHGSEMLVYRGEAPKQSTLDLTLSTMAGSLGLPAKYGYANVGRVVEIGYGVDTVAEGDIVFAFNPHETSYALPSTLTVPLPTGTEPRTAVFLANVETAINAMLDAGPRLGERIIILGQGVVGLLITQLCRKAGAELVVTVDRFENRRALSRSVGAHYSFDPDNPDLEEFGADLVFEATGNPEALNTAIQAVTAEGTIIALSWYGTKRSMLDLGDRFHRRRIKIKSSQVSNLPPETAPRWNLERRRQLAASYLNELHLEELITHTFRFEEAADAYRIVDEHPEGSVQVILEY